MRTTESWTFPHIFLLATEGLSRNPECRIHATAGVCKLGRTEEEEAIMLMLKAVGHEDKLNEASREIAKSVVAILGCLAARHRSSRSYNPAGPLYDRRVS